MAGVRLITAAEGVNVSNAKNAGCCEVEYVVHYGSVPDLTAAKSAGLDVSINFANDSYDQSEPNDSGYFGSIANAGAKAGGGEGGGSTCTQENEFIWLNYGGIVVIFARSTLRLFIFPPLERLF